METVKNTKAELLSPAPTCISPTNSEMSEDVCNEEEEQDDFYNQMDENGIIGLTLVEETQEHDDHTEYNRKSFGGREEPDMPPEELNYIFDEHLKDVAILSPYGAESEWGLPSGPVNNSKEESEIISEHQFFESPPLIEADGDCKPQYPTYQASARPTLPIFTRLCHLEEMAAAPRITSETIPDMFFADGPTDSNSLMTCESSLHHQDKSENTEQILGKDAISLQSQMRPADSNSIMSCEFGLHHQESSENEEQIDVEEDVISAQQRMTNQETSENSKTGPKKPTHSPTHVSHHCRDAVLPRTSGHNKPKEDCCHSPRRANESRKAYPTHWVPDLSQVKPRVSFPKGDYKPPKSRWSSKNPPKSLTPEAPVVFKSPAEIVKEVLLNTNDGPQPPFDFNKRTSPNGTVPQEFRSQQKAGILLDQLQEDHGRLLTKYAEAANTIDRLRLEAKVNLYSDQPTSAQVMPSGLHVEPSKFMRLDFPQAQKAQPRSFSLQPSGPGTHLTSSGLCLSASISKSFESQSGQKVANALYAQADNFLQQLQHYEDSLKSNTPFQQGLAELYQGLDSLEKGYLSARREHKVLQEQGAEHGHFDPNRELEEFIYQCGRHMDELKERTYQNSHDADSALCPQAQKSSPSDNSQAESQHTLLLLDSGDLTKKDVTQVNQNSSDFNKRHGDQTTDINQSSTVHLTYAPKCRRRKELRKSYSSSQSSLAEINTSEKRSAKPKTGIRRVLSQDGVISPGTDSGFVGSEYSHQIWAENHSSCHQRASKRVSGPAEVSVVKPQIIRTSTPSRDYSQSHRRTLVERSEYFQQEMRRPYPGERNQRQWISQTYSIKTDSETTHTAPEDLQSDQYEETLPCSSPSSSSSSSSSSTSAVHHHQGDALKTLRSSQVVTCNDSSQALQAKSITPEHKGENPMTNHRTVTHTTQGNCTQHRTSHPLRSQDPLSEIGGCNRKKWTIDRNEVEKVARRTARKRLAHQQQTRDTSTATEDVNSACRLLVSRSTQTSIAVADSQPSHTSAQVQHTKRDHTECSDDNDGRTSRVVPCSQCFSHTKVSLEKPAGGNQEPAQFCSCRHCHHCGHSDIKTNNEKDCWKDSNTPRTSSCTRTETLSRAAPPAVCPSLCPTPLLLYLQPQPIHVCTNNAGSPSKVSNCNEEERLRPASCLVPQRSIDDALLAARKMNDRSKRMVRSLTAGLRSLERLSKSHSNSNSNSD
ncbi:uncharacterized protein akna isoform X1 [Syngnathus scovelli]|uniref:uncharacterized protein akna isoform X1 n=1 Tax=Syngnathus scovelli TaxID=161590 RepID=UPI00210FB930|nr:uncharacterized protein LOC125979191 isoform X1 [Syngnathus scovelli]